MATKPQPFFRPVSLDDLQNGSEPSTNPTRNAHNAHAAAPIAQNAHRKSLHASDPNHPARRKNNCHHPADYSSPAGANLLNAIPDEDSIAYTNVPDGQFHPARDPDAPAPEPTHVHIKPEIDTRPIDYLAVRIDQYIGDLLKARFNHKNRPISGSVIRALGHLHRAAIEWHALIQKGVPAPGFVKHAIEKARARRKAIEDYVAQKKLELTDSWDIFNLESYYCVGEFQDGQAMDWDFLVPAEKDDADRWLSLICSSISQVIFNQIDEHRFIQRKPHAPFLMTHSWTSMLSLLARLNPIPADPEPTNTASADTASANTASANQGSFRTERSASTSHQSPCHDPINHQSSCAERCEEPAVTSLETSDLFTASPTTANSPDPPRGATRETWCDDPESQ